MRKQRKYRVEVEGRGPFPYDMLRYDRGQFATDADRLCAENSRGGTRYVTVICDLLSRRF